MTDNVPALVSYVDKQQHYRFVNQRYEQAYGVPRMQFIGKHVQEMLGPEGYAAAESHIAAALAGDGVSYEERFNYPDVGPRWMTIDYVPDIDDAGEVQGFIGLISDITARKQAEEALKASEEKFRAVIEQSPVSIQIHGLDGKLLLSNAAYAKLYALNDETLKELYAKYDVRTDVQAETLGLLPFIERAYSGEEVLFPPYEYDGIDTLKTLDFENPVSRKCWVQTRGFALKDNGGSVTSVVFMSEDITARKKAESQREAALMALRESEDKLRAVYQALPVATYTWQRKGDDFILVDYNHMADRATEGKIADLIGVESERARTTTGQRSHR